MKSIIIMGIVVSLGFSEVLEIDSITDPGNWSEPENILISNDLYGSPSGNQDVLTLSFADPVDTADRSLDSVKVYLEQYVSDTARARWYLRPVINGTPRTATPQQAGTLTDSVLCFNISSDITGWADLYDFEIDIHPKVGTGQQPEWYADHCYVSAYNHTITSIDEYVIQSRGSVLLMPTIVCGALILRYTVNTSSIISLEVYNALGTTVFSKEIHGTTGVNTITLNEIGQLSSGIYYLLIKTDTERVQPKKFIVVN